MTRRIQHCLRSLLQADQYGGFNPQDCSTPNDSVESVSETFEHFAGEPAIGVRRA